MKSRKKKMNVRCLQSPKNIHHRNFIQRKLIKLRFNSLIFLAYIRKKIYFLKIWSSLQSTWKWGGTILEKHQIFFFL